MLSIYFLVIFVVLRFSAAFKTSEIENTVLYDIKWKGKLSEINETSASDLKLFEKLSIRLGNNNDYECRIPVQNENGGKPESLYSGPTAVELLKPLFNAEICSPKYGIYWSYDICHGRHVKQFHDELKNGINKVTSSFILARIDKKQLDEQFSKLENAELINRSKQPDQQQQQQQQPQRSNVYPRKKIAGSNLAYIEIKMTNGDLCDMTQHNRSANVLYVCGSDFRHEVYSVQEQQTCHYEIVILSSLLCKHPEFRVVVQENVEIEMYAIDTSPKKPYGLLKMHAEAKKLIKTVVSELEHRFKRTKLIALDNEAKSISAVFDTKMEMFNEKSKKTLIVYKGFMKKMVHEKGCWIIHQGWWRIMFCFRQQISQYHVNDKDEKTDRHVLGVYDEAEHKRWLAKNPDKRPKVLAKKRELYYYFAKGDKCMNSITRSVIVNLRCLERDSFGGDVTKPKLDTGGETAEEQKSNEVPEPEKTEETLVKQDDVDQEKMFFSKDFTELVYAFNEYETCKYSLMISSEELCSFIDSEIAADTPSTTNV